jgi:hypothetical protein
MDIVEKERKLEQLFDRIGNMLESTQHTKSILIKPKGEVIYDLSMFEQLAKEVRSFGAVWFPWSGVFVIPNYEESASPARQEFQGEKMGTVRISPECGQMLGNMVESTQYIKSVVIRPKGEVMCDSSMLRQLYVEVTRVGAVWFSQSGVFVIPEGEGSDVPVRQGTSQVETRTPVTEEHSNQSTGELLDDRVNIELERLRVHFGKKMSKSAVLESVAFLLSRGFKPEEIAVKVGAGRATIYRHILQDETDNSVSR